MSASTISKVFDTMNWYSSITIQTKITLQRIWELGIGWDDTVPDDILNTWTTWRSELHILASYLWIDVIT